MNPERILIVQVADVHLHAIRHLFNISDVLRTVSVVATRVLLSAPSGVVLVAELTCGSIQNVSRQTVARCSEEFSTITPTYTIVPCTFLEDFISLPPQLRKLRGVF